MLRYQQTAMDVIGKRAATLRGGARQTISSALRRAGLREQQFDDALARLRSNARIALHFHPERLSRNGKTVAESLLASGIYMNQFETGLSSGSPSAFVGGERDQWEERLFGGAYHGTDVMAAGRPKYGALDIMGHPDGPSPRFGSCYFLLRPHVAARSSFTFGGSQEENAPDCSGTLDFLEPVFAPLLSYLEKGQGALGVETLSIGDLIARLADHREGTALGRALDSFIEAQVHGDLSLVQDMESLVADPAFAGHPVGDALAAIAERYKLPLRWHPGFVLPADQVPDIFRDYPVRPLAERIAKGGMLDAARIGMAANSVTLEPEVWRDWAAPDDIGTQFRRLWHVMVLQGTPRKT